VTEPTKANEVLAQVRKSVEHSTRNQHLMIRLVLVENTQHYVNVFSPWLFARYNKGLAKGGCYVKD